MVFLVEAVCGCVNVGPGSEGVVRTGYLVACVKQFTYFLDHSVGCFWQAEVQMVCGRWCVLCGHWGIKIKTNPLRAVKILMSKGWVIPRFRLLTPHQ